MKFRPWIVVVMVIVALPCLANAVCSAFYPTVVDGRSPSNYFVAASTTSAVIALVTPGHSYSVEFSTPSDSPAGPGVFVINLTAAGGDCTSDSTDTGGTVTDTTSADPALYGGKGHRRVSFIASTFEYVYAVVKNTDTGAPHVYRVTITDTSLYNPRWSTTQGYITVYGLQNTSTQTIHGTLTATITFGGTGTATYSLNGGSGIAPGDQLLVALGPGFALNVSAGEGGSAMLAHDGPPGGLTVDAYFANAVSLVPAVFVPRNSLH